MAETNPNGANQHTPDPRQDKCWELYVDSVRKGVPNAAQAARDAGYEESSASLITVNSWFIERLEKLKLKGMRSKAERNLDKMLETKWTIGDNDDKVLPDVMRIVADVSKTVAKSLGKEDWSERTELGGIDGKDLQINIVTYADHIATPIHAEDVPTTAPESNG